MAGGWLQHLVQLSKKERRLVAGVISGTSVDAIKVSLCEITGGGPAGSPNPARVSLKHFSSYSYPDSLKQVLYKSLSLSSREISELHVRIGEAFAEAVFKACQEGGVTRDNLDLIGSHGQTIYHHSNQKGALSSTLQIGDGDVIAERTGVTVISDFRARDIAAGGEGAPLTPYSDLVLFPPGTKGQRIVLNLGGVANITVLNTDKSRVLGFDTGPANGPLDRLARLISKGELRCDVDGKLASSGKVNSDLLRSLLEEDTYLKKSPPKSTGFEMYGDEFIERLVTRHGRADADLLATVTQFVARSIADALNRFVPGDIDELIVAGGGQRNPALLQAIQEAVKPIPVNESDIYGVPSQARESMGFAILANDALLALPTTLPSVTGAMREATLGKLSFPSLL